MQPPPPLSNPNETIRASSRVPPDAGAVAASLTGLRQHLETMVSSGAARRDGAGGGDVAGDQPAEVVSMAWDGTPKGFSARVACRAALL